jgi:hypothetical protein
MPHSHFTVKVKVRVGEIGRSSQSATIGVGMSVAIEFCKQFT